MFYGFSPLCFDNIHDYGHDTNACRELKNQIEEAVKSGKLAHLVKGIRKGREKTETQLEEWQALAVRAEPVTEGKEEPIMMTEVVNNHLKRKETSGIMSEGEMIFPMILGRVLLDGGAACDIMYEHCFLKLQKEVKERRKDMYTTLSGFYVLSVGLCTDIKEMDIIKAKTDKAEHEKERV
ncbi:hypothetical protein Tco_0746044 [Tanacetum coccineum]